MIQRKDSLSFMEFIRGKYDVSDIEYIKKLLGGMTKDERQLIMSSSFETLWNHVWYQPSIPRLTLEFETAKNKFQALCENNKLSEYIDTTISPYHESEYGFPKGRRKLKENDATCAVREFSEETGFFENEIAINPDQCAFEEIFYGTNNVLYRHVYYLARMLKPDSDNPQIDPTNINQAREVRAIQWCTKEETLANIRDYNKERKELFEIVHSTVLRIEDIKQCQSNIVSV
jgi:8-oxo-dGTP pyrophosphatase MutT (NUDIX family)